MTLADYATIATAFIALAAFLGSFALWATRAVMKPTNIVIKNNTEALDRIGDRLEKHAEKIGEHEVRIVKIETVHEIESGGGGK